MGGVCPATRLAARNSGTGGGRAVKLNSRCAAQPGHPILPLPRCLTSPGCLERGSSPHQQAVAVMIPTPQLVRNQNHCQLHTERHLCCFPVWIWPTAFWWLCWAEPGPSIPNHLAVCFCQHLSSTTVFLSTQKTESRNSVHLNTMCFPGVRPTASNRIVVKGTEILSHNFSGCYTRVHSGNCSLLLWANPTHAWRSPDLIALAMSFPLVISLGPAEGGTGNTLYATCWLLVKDCTKRGER